ncbi:alpha-L-rhamnosidase N-terminal domain-containing protein, partial [candidate division KSB1 bacterium]
MSRLMNAIGFILFSLLLCPDVTPAAATAASGRDWRARWIWLEETPADSSLTDLSALFRQNFRIEEKPEGAELFISADSRYKLWINGGFIGRGPARCDPSLQQYDRHDVTSHLLAGENVLAVMVRHYGRDKTRYVRGRPGLLAELVSTGADKKVILASGDGRFRGIADPAHSPVRLDWVGGVREVFDARRGLPGWNEPDFNDAQWPEAVRVESPGREKRFAGMVPMEPWIQMEERRLPYLEERVVAAVRVIETGTVVDWADPNREPSQRMWAEELEPDRGAILNPEAILTADGVSCTVLPPGLGRSVYITLDFGRESSGYCRMETADGAGGVLVDMGISPWLFTSRDRNRQSPGKRGRVDPSAGGGAVQRLVLAEGRGTWESFHRGGFRYMQVNFRNVTRPIKVDAVTLNS